jgi:hypothetical protein
MVKTRSKTRAKEAGTVIKTSRYKYGMGSQKEGHMPTWAHIGDKRKRRKAQTRWEKGDTRKLGGKGNYHLMERSKHFPYRSPQAEKKPAVKKGGGRKKKEKKEEKSVNPLTKYYGGGGGEKATPKMRKLLPLATGRTSLNLGRR